VFWLFFELEPDGIRFARPDDANGRCGLRARCFKCFFPRHHAGLLSPVAIGYDSTHTPNSRFCKGLGAKAIPSPP